MPAPMPANTMPAPMKARIAYQDCSAWRLLWVQASTASGMISDIPNRAAVSLTNRSMPG